jgi:hypothetical protein
MYFIFTRQNFITEHKHWNTTQQKVSLLSSLSFIEGDASNYKKTLGIKKSVLESNKLRK